MDWKDNPNYPAVVRERLKVVEQTAVENLEAINTARAASSLLPLQERLERLVKSRDPVWVRLRRLYQIADEEAQLYGDNVACRRGCSHCCYIAVAMTPVEAAMLGSAIKRKPKAAPNTDLSDFSFGYHNPCTFLKNGECSIYAHRPLACRTYFNLDRDSLLCQLIPPDTPPVPGISTAEFHWAYIQICDSAKTADIRQFFPSTERRDSGDRTSEGR